MLQVKNTANYTGICVSGNYDDLNHLYKAFLSVIGGDDEYSYNAAPRRRILDVCREICCALQGKYETSMGNWYAFRVLWPEAAFIAAVLDNFIFLSKAKMFYDNRFPEIFRERIQAKLSDNIALIHYFQELVWNELEGLVGEFRVRTIFGNYNDLRVMHFKYPQLDGFYTQWLDLMNIMYLYSEPDRRKDCLAAILTKMFSVEKDYLAIKNSIETYAQNKGIRVTAVGLADFAHPDNIEW